MMGMKVKEVGWIVNVELEMTLSDLGMIEEMCTMSLENYFLEEVVEYKRVLDNLRTALKRVKEFEKDSTITLGYF